MEIPLPGLRGNHPAGALAAFGLYVFFEALAKHDERIRPDRPVELSFVKDKGYYHALLHTNLTSEEQFITVLTRKVVWDTVFEHYLPTVPYWHSGQKKLRCEGISPDQLHHFCATDPHAALGLANDNVIKKKKNQCQNSPLFDLIRRRGRLPDFKTWINFTETNYNYVRDCLMTPHWNFQWGYGEFPLVMDFPSGAHTPRSSDEKGVNAPPIALLAFASFSLMPSFLHGKSVLSPGWRVVMEGGKSHRLFHWPVFDKPTGKETFKSLLLHPHLPKFGKDTRSAWREYGVQAVYSAERTFVSKMSKIACLSSVQFVNN